MPLQQNQVIYNDLIWVSSSLLIAIMTLFCFILSYAWVNKIDQIPENNDLENDEDLFP
jgi:hypothetical protein